MFYLNPYLLCAAQKKGKHEHSTAKRHHFGLLRDVSQIMQHVNMIFTAAKVNVFLLIITCVSQCLHPTRYLDAQKYLQK